MSPSFRSLDPLQRFPDVVAALAVTLEPVAPPERLKERLDARLRQFAKEREASENLLSRPIHDLRDCVLSGPSGRRATKDRPIARVIVSVCGREAAFFCWCLPPLERFTLVFERADGSVLPCAKVDTDGTGGGEIPYVALPSGPSLTSVELRRASSDEAFLSAKL